MVKLRWTIFLILIICFLSIGTVSAANWTVNPGSSIQSVINNASCNDTVIVNDNNGSAYTYTENVVINKTIALQAKAGGNVTLQALNSSKPVIMINSLGNGTVIQGFTIKGASADSSNGILLNMTSNCNITGNNLTGNYNGIYLNGSNNNTIQNNTIITNSYAGIGLLSSNNNRIQNNTITDNTWYGVYLGYSNGVIITGNIIANTVYGINPQYSSASIHFNRITGCSSFGLVNQCNSTINATNNWWGSNTPTYLSSPNWPSYYDIWNANGTVYYNPWLVLSVTASPASTNGNSTVTANLTRNNQGGNTSSQGNIPDNIPINFTTNVGTVTGTVYTRSGKANATFGRGKATSGTATVKATLDKQTVQNSVTIDTTPPKVTASLAGGIYNMTKSVTLTATDNFDSNPVIYYSTNKGATWNRRVKTVTLNLNQGVTNLKFYARDKAGNIGATRTVSYTIDTTAPIVTANPAGGNYSTTQVVTLTATDNLDSNPVIYYTTNGSNPTTYSTKYTGPISIANTTALKFTAVDKAGNQASVQTQNYTLNLLIINLNTGKGYPRIQDAINDSLTQNGHIIEVKSGTYSENIVVNKKLTIRSVSGGNVTIQAANSSNPVFTVNSFGNSTTIHGFTIKGATGSYGIYLNSSNNCNILGNTITGNSYGIYLYNSLNNTISKNTIMNNEVGIYLLACSLNSSTSMINKISENNIQSNSCGIRVESEDPGGDNQLIEIIGNNITGNNCGIYAGSSTLVIHFNRIAGNSKYGLYINNDWIDAKNNWWGSNKPVIDSNNPNLSDIYYPSYKGPCDIYYGDHWYYDGGGISIPRSYVSELYSPYIVLRVNATPDAISGTESIIAADLTHNNKGENTSSNEHVPDGIPVNFTTNMGTITTPVYTKNGKATSNLKLSENILSGTANITATVDKQSVSTVVTKIPAKAILTVTSTALDPSTGHWVFNLDDYYAFEEIVWAELGMGMEEFCYMMYGDPYAYDNPYLMPELWDYCYNPLSLTCEIPLNDSVTQVSVLWKEYTNVTDPFKNELDIIVNGNVVQSKVFMNAAYLYARNYYSGTYGFIFFEAISSINRALANVDDINSPDVQSFLDLYRILLTPQDFNFIMNNRLLFTDKIYVTLSYPGESAKVISVNPGNSSDITLKFGGNLIQRMSTVLYRNGGYMHCLGDPYDPNATFEHRYAGYEGVRSFAIATTRVTDETLQYWLDKKPLYQAGPMKAAYGTFLTSLLMIKCHDMVADAAASKFNVIWSRTAPIVVSVCDDAYDGYMTLECDHRFGMDVLGDPGNVKAFRFACSMAINPIEHWVMRTLFPNDNGTSITIGLGQKILNGAIVDIFMSNGYLVIKSQDNTLFLVIDPETGIVRDVMVTNSTFSYGSWCYSDQQTEWASDLGNKLLSGKPEWLDFVGGTCIIAGSTVFVGEGVIAACSNPLVLGSVALFCAVFFGGNYLCDQYGWLPPRNFNEDCKTVIEFMKNTNFLWLGTLAMFLPEDRAPTLEELQEAYWKAGQLLMSIAENNDIELYNTLIEIGKQYLMGKKVKKGVVGTNTIEIDANGKIDIISIPPDKLDIMLLKNAILNTCRFIKGQGVKLVNGVKAGDPVAVTLAAGGISVGTGVLVLLLQVAFNVTELLENFKKFWEQDTNNTSNTTSGGSGGGG